MLRAASGLLDFGQPVAVLLIGILHLIPDADDPAGIVARLIGALPAAAGWPSRTPRATSAGQGRHHDRPLQPAGRHLGDAAHPREISAFFAGTDLLPPGVVQYHQWHPGEPARDAVGEVAAYCGLAQATRPQGTTV